MKIYLSEIIAKQEKAVHVLDKILGNSNSQSEATQQARMSIIALKECLETMKYVAEKDKVGTWLLLKSKERIETEVTFGGEIDSELMEEQVEALNAVFKDIERYYDEFMEDYKSE